MTGASVDERPRVGPFAVVLVAILVLSAAWSIEDARWVLGQHELTGFLGLVGMLAVAWGSLAGFLGWRRLPTYLVGSVIGFLVVGVIVGWTIVPGSEPYDALVATAVATVEAYLDLAVRGRRLTPEVGHYMLSLGLVVWGTGLFASYAVIRRRRVVDAIVVTGFVLLVNMSLTSLDQLRFLVVFSLGALLLLVRSHASDEVATWLERRMGGTEDVSSIYLRGGVAFAVAAIAGSLLLTSTASSAPLAGIWTDARQTVTDLGAGLERFFPRGGPGTRITGLTFGSEARISGQWVTDSSVALRIQLPKQDLVPYYWKAVAYDRFELSSWGISETGTVTVGPGESYLEQLQDAVGEASAMTTVTYEVLPETYRGRPVLTTGVPRAADVETRLRLLGGRYFSVIERDGDGAGSYTVESLVPKLGDAIGGLTENKLRAAGNRYPAEITARYLELPAEAYGPNATALMATIAERSPSDTPYDIAKTTERYLRSSVFVYSTNVVGLPCDSDSVVECFATFRTGYCQHYASTMTVLLRAQGIPARYVEGFLPGDRDGNGLETVRTNSSHAWVEVYFPRYGWVPFDPTGGGLPQLRRIPTGDPAPSATPRGDGTNADDEPLLRDEPDDSDTTSGSSGGSQGGGAGAGSRTDARGPLTAVGVGLLGLAAWLSFLAYRRGPTRPTPPSEVFGRVSRIAARLGFARRPNETIYEYAGSLGDALPGARPELHAVASATVEVAYGRRSLGEERLAALAAAERRIRVALLRLVLRPVGRRGGGSGRAAGRGRRNARG